MKPLFKKGDIVRLNPEKSKIKWKNLRCRIVDTEGVNSTYYNELLLQPLSERPDGLELHMMYWPKNQIVLGNPVMENLNIIRNS